MPSKARICSASTAPDVPVTKDVCENCAAFISITVLAAWIALPTMKWPLFELAVESQSWYSVMTSLSASVTENRLDKGKVWFAVRLKSVVVTTGARSGGTVMVKGAQDVSSAALQAIPSKARICRLSPTLPVTNEVVAMSAALMVITVPAACATPLTTK
jgi:hypothetical protein